MEKKYIRIFVSSTFNDFVEEREKLTKEVFPNIKSYCQDHGFIFQAVDLRWGITSEEVTQQDTIRICLEEVAKCQEVSPRPNFFLLLGDRYGWEPLPPDMPQHVGDQIKAFLATMPNDREGNNPLKFFQKWYKIDYNMIDSKNKNQHFYILQPEQEKGNFQKESDILLDMLRFAAEKIKLPKEEFDPFFYSATKFEIKKGIDETKKYNLEDSPFICFFRKIENINKNIDVNLSKEHRLNELKNSIKNINDNLFFEINLDKMPTEDGYLKQFAEESEHKLKQLIDFRIAQISKEHERLDSWEIEQSIHKKFADERRECFVGRDYELNVVQEFVCAPQQKTFILHGKGGVGKSAFMAEVVDKIKNNSFNTYREEIQGCILLYRFVGASAASSDSTSLLRSICNELLSYEDIKNVVKGKVPEAYSSLCEFFKLILNNIEKLEKHVVIIVDAIDQLVASNNENSLGWIPTHIPKNIVFIASILEEDLKNVKNVFKNAQSISQQYLKLNPLLPEESMHAIKSLLASNNRAITPVQEEFLSNFFGHEVYGLYIRMTFEKVRFWKSYDAPKKLPPNLNEFIGFLFTSLTNDKRHIAIFAKRVLGLFAITYQGIAEDEVLAIFGQDKNTLAEVHKRFPFSKEQESLPFILWARFYSEIGRYLKTVSVGENTHYQYYHRLLEEFVKQKLLDKNFALELHNMLIEYFHKQNFYFGDQNHYQDINNMQKNLLNVRKLTALPYHLQATSDVNKLQKLLHDEKYFIAKVSSGLLYPYMHEAMWVHHQIALDDCKKIFLQRIFQLAVLYSRKNDCDPVFWNDLHGFIIYTRVKDFHKNFFDNAESVEKILEVVPELQNDVDTARKIYKACVAHRANYYRRNGEVAIAEQIVLQGFQNIISDEAKLETDSLKAEVHATIQSLYLENASDSSNAQNTNSQLKEKQPQDRKALGVLLYEYGFIQFLQNEFENSFITMIASSQMSIINNDNFGKLLPLCVGHHFRAFAALYTNMQNEYMLEYKEVLDNSRIQFEEQSKSIEAAKRWYQANTIEHLGFIAAYQENVHDLDWCVNKYETSPWVQRTEDKSNLLLMQARQAEIKAHLSKDIKDYEKSCEKIQSFIEYRKKFFDNDESKVEHLSQFYLFLGNSYLGANNLSKAREAWENAKNLSDIPGNKIWREEAERQLLRNS